VARRQIGQQVARLQIGQQVARLQIGQQVTKPELGLSSWSGQATKWVHLNQATAGFGFQCISSAQLSKKKKKSLI
jgi:hypothetical protein